MKGKMLISGLLAGCLMTFSCKQKTADVTSTQSEELSVPRTGNFMGVPYELAEAPNGALVNKKILSDYKMYKSPLTSLFTRKEVVKVAEGIYSIQGIYVGNVSVIETKNGVVLFDTGERPAEGEEILKLLRTVTEKPVIAIIYSHSHYISGSSVFVKENPKVQIIAHEQLQRNIASSGGVGGAYPELSPLLIGGVLQQFHMLLPKKGTDAPFGAYISIPDITGYAPPTRTVKNLEIVNIDGVDFQFFTDYDMDSNDQLLVWLPRQKLIMNNLLWGIMPNIYSLRGSNYRDPETIIKGLNKIRELKPEIILSVHAIPQKGEKECSELAQNTADFYTFIKDQTMRAMLLGNAPQDLGRFVKMPKHLKELDYLSETYGLLENFPEAIYQFGRGWFDGDAANIFKIPRKTEANNLIKAIGGADRVIKLVDEAVKANDQVWALKLANYLYISDPTNQQYRNLKAQLLYQMGIVLESQNARSWCLTQARALTNKMPLPRLVIPKEMVQQMPPQMLISQYKVRIDPIKAEDTDFMLNFVVDGKTTLGLHCRHGVVEYVADVNVYEQKADATLILSAASLMDLFMNVKPVSEILSGNGTTVEGDKGKVVQFLSLFDEILSPAVNQHVPVLKK
jgi:alkyl sulfatase BDS1-like metallo-beta-lactamase superfamily hydrolase